MLIEIYMCVSETKLHNSTNRNWLNKLLTGYKWWSSPKGTGGTLVCVRTKVASMSRAKLTYQDDDGRIVAITLHSEDKNLLVVGTYCPASGSPEALNKVLL